MPDGVVSTLGSLARGAYGAASKLAGATQRAVSPELTRAASACQLIDALENSLGDEVGRMIKAGQQDQAKGVVEASKRLTELKKTLSCPVR